MHTYIYLSLRQGVYYKLDADIELMWIILTLQAVRRQFRALLSKIRPHNFQTLMTQMLQLPINSELRLKNAVDTIFENVSALSFLSSYSTCEFELFCHDNTPRDIINMKLIQIGYKTKL